MPELDFDHNEEENGGSTWPDSHIIRGLHPETGEPVGFLKYRTPRRAKDKIQIDRLEVHPEHQGNGYGSALMDHLQERHPKTPIDHGDRTEDGKKWWAGYSKGKSVQKGRTIAKSAEGDNPHWWSFTHHHLEGPHHRLVGVAPQTEGGKTHLLQYTVTPKKTIKFNQNDLDRMGKGPQQGAMRSGVFEKYPDHEEHDPNYHDPRPAPKPGPVNHEYYHGTTVPNVSHILPPNQHGGPQVFSNGLSSRDHAYATTSEADAWEYAEKAWNAAPSGRPRVYRVHPIGGHEDVEPDPQEDEHGNNRYVNQNDHRSTQGFHVLHEMPMPHHMGDPEDWDR